MRGSGRRVGPARTIHIGHGGPVVTPAQPITTFLCGDVMTGRGVDQILAHPGDPHLWEAYATDARDYVALAESANGPIARPVDDAWPWGEALPALADHHPDVRLINLETSVTGHSDVAWGKQVHYRMAPDNIGCLTVARPDVCALANNHVLDFGQAGLVETLRTLSAAGLAVAGAGLDADQARRPAIVDVRPGHRVVVFAFGHESSGVPPQWAASADRPGVDVLPDLSGDTADAVAAQVAEVRRDGDFVIVSIHWGSNWGYHIPTEQISFAHRLIDHGVDLIHGHSSHHPRGIELYRDRLVLYGCGDFIDDYEGIHGYEEFRGDLRLLYFAASDPGTGALLGLELVPMQARQLRLHHASSADAEHLAAMLTRASQGFGTRVELADGLLRLAA
ncbi:MAG TPA: CapA family protein [Micromonosporaceae bacterium]